MNSLISVIIPVYNVEKFLEQALNSVLQQTYQNIEIICIDDCSEDSSLNILEKYASFDKRIKVVINSENKGAGYCRNKGLELAKGEYIHFFDSDDFLELNLYETFIKYLNEGLDIFVFTYNTYDEKTKKLTFYVENKENFPNGVTNLHKFPSQIQFFGDAVWNKVFSKKFLIENNIIFSDYKCLEDLYFNIEALVKAKNIAYSNKPFINYRKNRLNSMISKEFLYTQYLVNDIEKFNTEFSYIDTVVKSTVQAYLYANFISHCKRSYDKKIMRFDDMKLMFKNIDLNILHDFSGKSSFWTYKFAQKVVNKNKINFWFSYNLREFIKKYFPNYTILYFKIKRGIHCF